MDISNSNPNFSFPINLSGIRAASGGGMKLPEGYYEGVITDAFQTTSKNGRPQAAIKVTMKGDFEGMVRTSWIGIPQSAEDGVRYIWRAVFESAKYPSTEIDAGEIQVSREVLVGRDVTVFYKPGDKDMGVYEDLKFLAPHTWAQKKTHFEASVSAPASALGSTGGIAAAVSAPAPAGNGIGNTVTKDGLLAALNR